MTRPSNRPLARPLSRLRLALLATAVHAMPVVAQPETEAALAAVRALARVNGQALACQDHAAARRAKALMLAHAPKTARFGDAYESVTQQSYLATTQANPPCAEPAERARQLDTLTRELQTLLPPAAAAR